MIKNRLCIGLVASLLLHAVIAVFMAWHLLHDDSANNQSVNSPIISMSIEMVAAAAPAEQEQAVEPEPIPPPRLPEVVVAESPLEAKIALNKPVDRPRKRQPLEKHTDTKPRNKPQLQKKPVEDRQPKLAERESKSAIEQNRTAQTAGHSQAAGKDAVDSQAGARQATTSQPMIGLGSDDLQSYQSALRREIEKHKRYPRRAKKMKQQGTVQVRFSLLDSGDLTNPQLVQSSGADELDRAALAAIQQARSVGVKPPGLPRDLTLAIEFNLK